MGSNPAALHSPREEQVPVPSACLALPLFFIANNPWQRRLVALWWCTHLLYIAQAF